MQVKDYSQRTPTVRAIQVTPESMEVAESWCSGRIRGVKLPVHQRKVQFQGRYGELDAEIGDWIVRTKFDDAWIFWDVYSNAEFEALFGEVAS